MPVWGKAEDSLAGPLPDSSHARYNALGHGQGQGGQLWPLLPTTRKTWTTYAVSRVSYIRGE